MDLKTMILSPNHKNNQWWYL